MHGWHTAGVNDRARPAAPAAATRRDAESADGAKVLRGEVVAVVYADTASGFGVVEVLGDDGDDDGDGPPRAAGPLAGLAPGQPVRLVGEWTEHPRHGTTFQVSHYEVDEPRSPEGLTAFLASDRFPGVGKVLAARIVEAFGLELPRVLDADPEELARIPGVSRDLAHRVGQAWEAAGALAALVQRLGEAGASAAVARAAHRVLGDDAPALLDADPYELLRVPGGRWEHAEALAAAAGITPDDPRRQQAAAAAAHAELRERAGHVAAPASLLLSGVARLLGEEGGDPLAALESAVSAGRLAAEDDPQLVGEGDGGEDPRRWYLPAALRAERGLAADFQRLAGARSRVADRLGAAARDVDAGLTPEQAAGVRAALSSPVTVLTGGPGTGKTRAVVEVASVCEAADLRVALCAPTGRAAKRLEEVTGRPASTVHRLLEAQPAGDGAFRFGYGPSRRLPHDLVVADEVSMADLGLCAALVAAVDDGAHLLLVGDADQLPPVGPGAALRDVLTVAVPAEEAVGDSTDGAREAADADGDVAGGRVEGVGDDGRDRRRGPVVAARLRTVHRQAAASRIVTLAHEVNQGEATPPQGRDGDVFAVPEHRDAVGDRVAAIVAERAPAFFGCAPNEVQVLSPMYRGPAGVDALNAALRERLNPAQGRPAVAGLREGDRVVQTRNDPERGVANGDVGEVAAIDRAAATLEVGFPHGMASYDTDDAADLRLAWCLTVHKAQGGEWPVVVLVLDRGHRIMLARELVYTAITRAREGLILVGDPQLLASAARRRGAGLAERETLLAERLRTQRAG